MQLLSSGKDSFLFRLMITLDFVLRTPEITAYSCTLFNCNLSFSYELSVFLCFVVFCFLIFILLSLLSRHKSVLKTRCRLKTLFIRNSAQPMLFFFIFEKRILRVLWSVPSFLGLPSRIFCFALLFCCGFIIAHAFSFVKHFFDFLLFFIILF